MNKEIRVLITAHIRWYNAEAEYAHRLARGLWRKGVKTALWGRPGSPLLAAAQADGVPVVAGVDPGSLDPAKMAAATRLLARLVREGGFSLVNAVRSEGYPVIARAAKKAGAAVVRTRGDMRRPKLAALNRIIYDRCTDRVIAANDLLREELILRLGLPSEKIRTVRFGIRPGELKPAVSPEKARDRLGIKPGQPVLGLMGRLGPVKGQEFVLKAADRIAAEVPAVRFLVIYRDVEAADKFLPALKRSPHGPRFVLVGPGEDHLEAMSAADVAVIPSVGSEAHCRVALEWMALQKPVIGSRVGVIPEIIEPGATGFLVQPRYAEALARCAIQLLTDQDRAGRMGKAGRQRLCERFSEERMLAENLEVFREALAQKK